MGFFSNVVFLYVYRYMNLSDFLTMCIYRYTCISLRDFHTFSGISVYAIFIHLTVYQYKRLKGHGHDFGYNLSFTMF